MNDRPAAAGLALRVVLPCFLAQQLAFGVTFGSYGLLLAVNEAQFGVSLATASWGVGLFNLAIGLSAPVLGSVLQRVPAKTVMMAAAGLGAASYVCIAFASSFMVVLACYAVVGGCAAALGVLGPLTVISRWFSASRARMLGVVNLPVLMLLTPFAVGALLPEIGRTNVILVLAACYLVPIPVLAMMRERAPPPEATDDFDGVAPEAILSAGAIISRPRFWVLSLGIGIMAGASSVFVVHIVPFGTGQGLSLEAASGLVSIFAAFGLIGSLLMGWAADRIGAPGTLVLATLGQAALWSGLLAVGGWGLFALAGLMGVLLVPVVTLHGAAMSQIMPVASVSRAMGLSYLIKLPFIFGFPPLAGILFDIADGYRLPFLVFAALALLASALFGLLRVLQRRPASLALA